MMKNKKCGGMIYEHKAKKEAETIAYNKAKKIITKKKNETALQYLSRLAKTNAKLLEMEYIKRGFNKKGF